MITLTTLTLNFNELKKMVENGDNDLMIISKKKYNELLETLYLLSDSTMREKLEAAKNATDEDYEVFEW